MPHFLRQAVLTGILITLAVGGHAQQPSDTVLLPSPAPPDNPLSGTTASAPPVVITLDEAIRRAETNEPTFASAVAAARSAVLDKSIARSSLLPNVVYHNQYLFTESSGARDPSGVARGPDAFIFIGNNAIHEYASQAEVTETLSLAGVAKLKHASAAAAAAAAMAEVARRGLVYTVVQQYFGLLAAEQKLRVARHATEVARQFTDLTRKREQQQVAAHADVLKAELELQQRQRDEQDAQLLADNSKLQLGILLFPDPRTAYALADDGQPAPPLLARVAVDAAARKNNPDVRAALEALRAASEDVAAARAAYLPELRLNWTYGIDAPQFATHGPLDFTATPALRPKNLGYSASATLDIPVWDWLATHNRVKQSQAQKSVAKVALTQAQKRLIAQLDVYYNEAEIAGEQVASLELSVKTATESLRLTNLRYKAGEATALEVVDADNMLNTTEQAYANGTARYRVALANLQTLTGVLP